MKIFLLLVVFQALLITSRSLAQDIYVVRSGNYPEYAQAIEGFWEVMESAGYSKKKHGIDYQLDEANRDEIVQIVEKKKPKLLFTVGNFATKVFAKSNVPVVFAMVLDPKKYKIIDSVENPGSNITGVTLEVPVERQLNSIKDTISKLRRVGVIYSADSVEYITKVREIAKNIELEFITQAVREEDEVINAFDMLIDSKIDILWLIPDSVVLRGKNKLELLQKAKQNKIPVYGPTAAYMKGKSGATISVTPDYRSIGMEAGELSLKVINSDKNVPISSPKKYILHVKKNSKAKLVPGAIVVE